MAYVKMQFKAKTLTRGVTIQAFLPSDAMSGRAVEPPYKTVYFLPGYSADSTEIINYLGLRRECELKGIAVILVDGCNSFYIDHPERNESFSSFVGQEVVEFTRKMLPLSDKRVDTYLAGISMGGYGALYNGLKFRNTFSKIAAFSPSVDGYNLLCEHPDVFSDAIFEDVFGSREDYFNGDTNLEKAYSQTRKEEIPQIFVTCGREDALVMESVEHFVRALKAADIPLTYRLEEGNHDLDFWERMMDPAFSFLADIPEKTRDRLVLGNFG